MAQQPEAPRSEFITALAAAQLEMGNALLNKTNPHFKSKYADFSAVREATLQILNKHGFAMIQSLMIAGDGALLLRTELGHVSGESRLSHFPVASGTPQQQGSAITYARRYSWSAMCGIASEEDDDGNEASATTRPKTANQARKEGFYPIAEKAIREQTTLDGLKQWWADNHDEIVALPHSWRALLEEEKDRCKLRLIDKVDEDTELKKQLKGSLV